MSFEQLCHQKRPVNDLCDSVEDRQGVPDLLATLSCGLFNFQIATMMKVFVNHFLMPVEMFSFRPVQFESISFGVGAETDPTSERQQIYRETVWKLQPVFNTRRERKFSGGNARSPDKKRKGCK